MKLNFNLTNRLNSITLKAVLVSALVAGATVAQAQTTYTWDGSAGDNSWSNPVNWTPDRITDSIKVTDVLIFNGSLVATPVVNLDFADPAEAISKLQVTNGAKATFLVASNKTVTVGNGAAAADFYIDGNSKLTVTNSVADAALNLTLAASNAAHINGDFEFRADYGQAAHRFISVSNAAVWFNPGSKFIAGSGFTGNAFGDAAAYKVTFGDNSNYINESGGHPFGSGTAPTARFSTGSTYTHRSLEPIPVLGQTYSNLVIDHPGFSAPILGSGSLRVDDLTVLQASSVVFSLDVPTNYFFGNMTVNSGTVVFTATSTNRNLYFHGDSNVKMIKTTGTGSIIIDDNCKAIVSADRKIQLNTNLIVRGTVQVNGELDMQGFTISSDKSTSTVQSGTFTLAAGGTFFTSHPQGIYKSPSPLGCILVTKNRGFGKAHYRYYGNVPQTTGTALPAAILSLTVDNPASVTLNGNVIVTEKLDLNQGLLYTNTNQLLTVDTDGQIFGSGPINYVHGPMARRIVTGLPIDLNFPIGKSDFRPVQLNLVHAAVEDSIITYTAELLEDAPTYSALPASLKKLSEVRYYYINKSTLAPLASGNVSLVFTQDEGFGVVHPEGVRVAKTIGLTNTWEDLGGTMNATNTQITSDSFTRFSYFALGRTSSTLPIALISLNAASEKETVLVNWATSKEENNDYFEVQRSTDGQHFQTIGKVEGMGNSANENNYAFTDFQPLSGLAYYRLRQVDFDGTASFHGPVAVRRATGSIGQLALYPNPAVNSSTLTFEAETDQVATIRVVNTIGQTVAQQSVSATKGLNSVTVPAHQLATGMYIVEMITESGTTAARLIKQ